MKRLIEQCLLLMIVFQVSTPQSLMELCHENGPCKCYEGHTRMVCQGQPLEDWWNPEKHGPHTEVTSLAILATTLTGPITSLRNFPNLKELEIQQIFRDNQCRQVLDDHVFFETQLTTSLTSVKFLNTEILCTIPSALHRLENLRSLEFRRTNLKLYNENDFVGLERLERLTIANVVQDFGHMTAVSYPARIFSRLDNLLHLSLEGNVNLQLHRGIFDGLEDRLMELNLKKCTLNDNHLVEFEHLRFLETLDLSENLLTMFSYNNLFQSHPNLKYLKLSGNRGIKLLDPNMFFGGVALIELYAAGAEIDILDLSFMRNTPNLKLVDVSENYATLFKIINPQGYSKDLPKAKLHLCKSSIGFVDPTLKDFLIYGGQMNMTDNTVLSCEPTQHHWLAEMVHCHKKHGLMYSSNTKCTSGEENSFEVFLQTLVPAVCKGIQNKPAAIMGMILLFIFTLIVYY